MPGPKRRCGFSVLYSWLHLPWQESGRLLALTAIELCLCPIPEPRSARWQKKWKWLQAALMQNYSKCGYTIVAPILAFAGGILALLLSGANRPGAAFVCSGAALAGVILTAGFAMFPFIIPSSTDLNSSLTVYDAVSSHRTLNLMFIAVVVFLPIVLVYTSWVYRVMRGKITEKKISEETHTAY